MEINTVIRKIFLKKSKLTNLLDKTKKTVKLKSV